MSYMKYKDAQYGRVENLINDSGVFYGDSGGGIFKKKAYPFVLSDCGNNLYAPVKDDTLEYFKKNKVAWWNGRLTNHSLSSQVACLNHLFPLREDKEAVLSIVNGICPNIKDVLTITTDQYKPAYIQFEAVSDRDHLNEGTSTRGSNCTSVDALILVLHKDGRRVLLPIEWKYVEVYSNENKAKGDKGETRKRRYTELINRSAQLKSDNHDVFYFEPFYQLMRQTLWAEQMIGHKDTETVQTDDYMHIHVIPSENRELLCKKYKCSGKGMEDTWRSNIKDQDKYRIVSPKDLLAPIASVKFRPLLDYLRARYW
jgi:hypothetical protein